MSSAGAISAVASDGAETSRARKTYTTSQLRSLSEFPRCKEPPSGFDPSPWRVLMQGFVPVPQGVHGPPRRDWNNQGRSPQAYEGPEWGRDGRRYPGGTPPYNGPGPGGRGGGRPILDKAGGRSPNDGAFPSAPGQPGQVLNRTQGQGQMQSQGGEGVDQRAGGRVVPGGLRPQSVGGSVAAVAAGAGVAGAGGGAGVGAGAAGPPGEKEHAVVTRLQPGWKTELHLALLVFSISLFPG
ncbi:unnamed protein product [Closterium sp. NIES-53]